jgi:hypothetical protein
MAGLDWNTIVIVIISSVLSGGGALSIGTMIKGIRTWREGVRTSRKGAYADAISDLSNLRNEADQRERECRHELNKWQRYAGQLERVCSRAGLKMPPSPDAEEPLLQITPRRRAEGDDRSKQ